MASSEKWRLLRNSAFSAVACFGLSEQGGNGFAQEENVSEIHIAVREDLIRELDSGKFDNRERATEELKRLGDSLPDVDLSSLSKEARSRVISIRKALEQAVLLERWNGDVFHLPNGWKEGEHRSVKKILTQLGKGKTGICFRNSSEIFLNSQSSVPKQGTPFWDAYQGILWNAGNAARATHVSAGMLYCDLKHITEEPQPLTRYTATSGALLAECLPFSDGGSICFYTDGSLHLRNFCLSHGMITFADGRRTPLQARSISGGADKALNILLPQQKTPNERVTVEMTVRFTAWPVHTTEIMDMHKEVLTPDGNAKFHGKRGFFDEVDRKRFFILDSTNFLQHLPHFQNSGPDCHSNCFSLEAFDESGNICECVHSLENGGRTSDYYDVEPASACMRSVDFGKTTYREIPLTFSHIRLPEKGERERR